MRVGTLREILSASVLRPDDSVHVMRGRWYVGRSGVLIAVVDEGGKLTVNLEAIEQCENSRRRKAACTQNDASASSAQTPTSSSCSEP